MKRDGADKKMKSIEWEIVNVDETNKNQEYQHAGKIIITAPFHSRQSEYLSVRK